MTKAVLSHTFSWLEKRAVLLIQQQRGKQWSSHADMHFLMTQHDPLVMSHGPPGVTNTYTPALQQQLPDHYHIILIVLSYLDSLLCLIVPVFLLHSLH